MTYRQAGIKPSIYTYSPFPHASLSKCNMRREIREKNEPISKKGLISNVLACVLPEYPVRWCRSGKVHKAAQTALQVAKWKAFTVRIFTNCFSFSCFIYYPSNETLKSWCIWGFYPRKRRLAGKVSWGAASWVQSTSVSLHRWDISATPTHLRWPWRR